MGHFNRFEKRHDDRPRQMFAATCSECGKQCEIPFKPVPGRPVYCNDCFKNQKSSGFNPGFTPKNFGDQNARSNRPMQDISATKSQIDALNVKLDKIISLLSQTKPTAEAIDKTKESKPKKALAKKASVKKTKAKKK